MADLACFFSSLTCCAGKPALKSARRSALPNFDSDADPTSSSDMSIMGIFTSNSNPAMSEPQRGRDSTYLKDSEGLKGLETLALNLARPIQKYPKSSRRFLKSPKERYIAIIPQVESRGVKPTLRDWINGWLAYWEDENDFMEGFEPLGGVKLMRISRVQIDTDCSGTDRGVVVKHKMGDTFHELILLLGDRRDAQEFCYMLWEFISKLRGQWSPDFEHSRKDLSPAKIEKRRTAVSLAITPEDDMLMRRAKSAGA